MSDEYFKGILQKYSKSGQHASNVANIQSQIEAVIRPWAGDCLKDIKLSGSFAKGTQTSLTSDCDLLVSFTSSTNQTTKEIYQMLLTKLKSHYDANAQNVSIGIRLNGFKVDVVPAKNHSGNTNDHWLYSNKKDQMLQTNVHKHINHVQGSNKTDEIKLTKIWAKLHNLDFPSFYLELATIEALKYREAGNLDLNFQRILTYLSEEFMGTRFVDPANTNNIISDLLSSTEKEVIAKKAKEGSNAEKWNGVIW